MRAAGASSGRLALRSGLLRVVEAGDESAALVRAAPGSPETRTVVAVGQGVSRHGVIHRSQGLIPDLFVMADLIVAFHWTGGDLCQLAGNHLRLHGVHAVIRK